MSDTVVDSTLFTFLVSLTTNAVIGIVVFIIFAYLQRWRLCDWCFVPRLVRNFEEPTGRTKPDHEPKNWFTWMVNCWKMPDSDLVKIVGLDALMLLRLFKFAIRFFAVAT